MVTVMGDPKNWIWLDKSEILHRERHIAHYCTEANYGTYTTDAGTSPPPLPISIAGENDGGLGRLTRALSTLL
jgi:hypothetical protein